jgi:signal transduction histidine kinase
MNATEKSTENQTGNELAALQSGMIVCCAVRNTRGALTDLWIMMLNAVAERDLGRPAAGAVGQPFRRSFPELAETEFFYHCQQVIETGEAARFAFEYTRPGQLVPTQFDVLAVRVDDTVVVSYTDSTQTRTGDRTNATAPQNTQGTGSQHPALPWRIMDGMPVGVALLSAVRTARRITNFRVDRINSRLQEVLCQQPPNVIGGLLTSVFCNAHESGLIARCMISIELGKTQRFEMPFSVNDTMGWYRVSVAPEGEQLILTITDVTEIRQAQILHHRQAELLNSVLDCSPNAIIAFDAVRDHMGHIVDFRYLVQNEINRQRMNCTDAEVIGHTMLELFPIAATSGLFDGYVRVVETGKSSIQDFTHDFGSGQGWYTVSAVKRGDGIVLTVEDKTAEKMAEETSKAYRLQLEAANEELHRSNENLRSFAYVASHDLQEPLRKIQAFGDMLTKQYTDQLGDGIDYLERMQAASRRMSTLIKDLLAYSRISIRQQVTTPVPLGEVVEGVLRDLELAVEETGAIIEVNDPLPTVQGDASQLGQLFQNLLGNAIKFRQTDRMPGIRVSSQILAFTDLPDFVKPAVRTDFYYRVDVTDNGIGFDQKYTDRIFQVFQRLHGRNQYDGTGIGLAICDKVATNHGGAIMATSQPGQGATFSVYFPA